MTKTTKTAIFGIFAAALLAVSPWAFADEFKKIGNWEVSDKADPISDEFTAYATSNSVAPDNQLNFPYGDVKAWWGVGCDISGSKWTYIGFSNLSSLDDKLRARWGDKSYTHRISISDDVVHFNNDMRIIDLLKSSSNVIIGIDWFQDREAFFTWDLTGSNQAINESFMRCKMESDRLIVAKTDVHAVDKSGNTALHNAALDGHTGVVKGLLAKGANVNAANNTGSTSLYNAALNGHAEVIKALLSSGADPDIANNYGKTAWDKIKGKKKLELIFNQILEERKVKQ